jgi:hypothetical protein
MSKQHSEEIALVCDLTALSMEQRRRYGQVRRQLNEFPQEVREVTNGYAFRYPADEAGLLLLAEFISLEGRCCPFLDFTLEVKSRQGRAWLTLTGTESVKEFLRLELDIEKDSLKTA